MSKDDIAEIKQIIIPKYEIQKPKKPISKEEYLKDLEQVAISKEDYLKDLERVVSIWNNPDNTKKQEIVDLLKKYYFVRCKNQIGDISFEQAETTYFDSDKLLKWFDGNPDKNIYFIDLKLSTEQCKFMENLGVKYYPRIVSGAEEVDISKHGHHEKSIDGFNPEFNIDGLEYALKNISFERSTFLWGILLQNANKLKGHTKRAWHRHDQLLPGVEQTSSAMKLLNSNKWLYDGAKEKLIYQLEKITCEQLNDEYKYDSNKKEHEQDFKRLFEVLGLKLDPVKEFEDKTGYIVAISEGERKALEDFRQSKKEKQTANWKPECSPEDVIDIYFKEGKSAQAPQRKITLSQNNSNSNADSPKKPHGFRAIRAIGDWGEGVAKRYLEKKYPATNNVSKGGIGCDFVIKDGEKEIAYYEIKSTMYTYETIFTESKDWFAISGRQWKLATEKVDIYSILFVSYVGKRQPIIREIKNPFGLWREGKLYADNWREGKSYAEDVWLHF